MSLRDPDWLTPAAPGTGPDALVCESVNDGIDTSWCLGCGDRRAKCDDYCIPCTVEFFAANPDEFDPEEQTPMGYYLWDMPGWRDAAAMIRNALETERLKWST